MALPVVFVHGVPEDAKLWDGVREHIIDRETFARKPKPSAWWLGEIARRNALE